MENYGAFCPNEECANNHGGNCSVRQVALMGLGAWAFPPLGTNPFMQPAVPIAGVLGDDFGNMGQYVNCPHRYKPGD